MNPTASLLGCTRRALERIRSDRVGRRRVAALEDLRGNPEERLGKTRDASGRGTTVGFLADAKRPCGAERDHASRAVSACRAPARGRAPPAQEAPPGRAPAGGAPSKISRTRAASSRGVKGFARKGCSPPPGPLVTGDGAYGHGGNAAPPLEDDHSDGVAAAARREEGARGHGVGPRLVVGAGFLGKASEVGHEEDALREDLRREPREVVEPVLVGTDSAGRFGSPGVGADQLPRPVRRVQRSDLLPPAAAEK